jgi:hypothetical protein
MIANGWKERWTEAASCRGKTQLVVVVVVVDEQKIFHEIKRTRRLL